MGVMLIVGGSERSLKEVVFLRLALIDLSTPKMSKMKKKEEVR
jgi:hypothetical protein